MTAILLFLALGCIIIIIIIIVWMGYSKIEMQCIRKNCWWIFKIVIPSAVGIQKYHLLMQLQGMDQNSLFLDAIGHEAIKSLINAHRQNYLSSNGITLKST